MTRNSVDLTPILPGSLSLADACKAAKDHWEVMKEIRDKKSAKQYVLGNSISDFGRRRGLLSPQIGRIVR